MNRRHQLSDERLEEELRALPEVEPPVDLADRVMAQVLAAAEPMEASPAAPRRAAVRATRWMAPWHLAAALLVLAVVAVPLLVRSWPELVLLTGRLGLGLVNGMRLAADGLTLTVTLSAALASHVGTALSALATVTSTVMQAALSQAGPLIVVMAAVAIGLQFVLLTIVRRRQDAA